MRSRAVERIVGAIVLGLVLSVISAPASPLQAGGRSSEEIEADLDELRRQIDVLAGELERLRSSEAAIEITAEAAQQLGLGPAAASVYRQDQGVSIAGYGEMLYENFAGQDESGMGVNKGTQLDFLRAVVYFGYRFNEKFLFNSEIEVEHSNEVGVEFAYVDYLAHPALTLRGGLLLVPMGLTNEFHEPNTFFSARRPETESRLLPSTWRENGFGVVGTAGKFNYRAYIVNGLDATGFSSNGLRGGRQKGSKARFTDPAFVGRLDMTPMPGVLVGGSFYVGDSSQGQFSTDGQQFSLRTAITEVHGQAQIRGFNFRALYARSDLNNVDLLNRARSLSGESGVGEVQEGGYFEIGYNLLSQVRPDVAVTPFYRFESLDTQERVAQGFLKDTTMDRVFHTLGLSFAPIQNVVVKADYQWIVNESEGGVNQFNVALGYSF
jgi:hypothetical protein